MTKTHKVYWGWDDAKGRLHVSSEPTRNLREDMKRQFGRAPLYREGDVLGELEWLPDTDTVFVHVYYGVRAPDELMKYVHEHYAGAHIRMGKYQEQKTASVPFFGGGILGPPIGPQGTFDSAAWARANLVTVPGELKSDTLLVKTANADMSGCMVALYPPEDVAGKLAVDDGEPADRLHITLIYFKDKAADRDDWEKIEPALEQICKNHFVLEGEIGGYGVFENNEEGRVLWAHPDVPHLIELRQALMDAVEKEGFEVSDDHGFSPHITLLYGHEGDLPKLDSPIPVHFDTVYFVRGDEKGEGSKLGKD